MESIAVAPPRTACSPLHSLFYRRRRTVANATNELTGRSLLCCIAWCRRRRSGGVRAGERDGDPDGHGAGGLPERRQLRHHLGTANNGTFFAGNGMNINPFSLDTQMLWFRTHLRELAQAAAAAGPGHQRNASTGALLGGALVALGEIGGNDYNLAFLGGVPRDTVRGFVPAVVGKLAAAVEELVGMGARAFVVPGNLPFGCAPLYLRRFGGDPGYWDYDASTGCLAWFNRFAEYHNRVLTEQLDRLRRRHPGTIVYADWYGAMMSIFRAPRELGTCRAAPPAHQTHCSSDRATPPAARSAGPSGSGRGDGDGAPVGEARHLLSECLGTY